MQIHQSYNIGSAYGWGSAKGSPTLLLLCVVSPVGRAVFYRNNMIKLRENQTEPIDKAIKFFREQNPEPSLIVLPTAWGKSILTAYVAKYCGEHIIVLQPSKELLEQNYKKYCSLCGGFGMNAGIFSASCGRKEIAPITYATIGSIKSLGKTFAKLGFTKMLIDEAHLYPREATSMLGRFLKDSGISHVLGITATPVKLETYLDKNTGLNFSKLVVLTSKSKKGNFYKKILHVGQVGEMVRLGYWSPLKYMSVDVDQSLLVFNSSKSEYTEESVQLQYAANGGSDSILMVLDARKTRKHIICYVPSVADAQELASRYPDSGVVYGEQDKKERERTINRFKAGELRVIFNVRVLSTGFDYTGIDCLVLGISTASIALYYQIIGRGTRIDPDKKDCLIVDLGGNVKRFGKVEDISYEEGGMWRMFGTDGKLLSGIPIHCIGQFTRKDTELVDKRAKAPLEIMPFGKYKGERIENIPADYRLWMLNNFQWTEKNEKLRQALVTTLKTA